jgi:lipopolysaccharide O-acetyltransferase
MIYNYTLCGYFRLMRDLVITMLLYPNARLVRNPIFVRGKRGIKWGEKLTTGFFCRLETYHDGKLVFGNQCQINDFVHISACKSVEIGNNVLIASKVFISDHNHGNYKPGNAVIQDSPFISPVERCLYSDSVVIEDNVWIGEGVAILPGVRIGFGSIIGANSVVTKSIPSFVVATGNPCRVIKKYNENTNSWEKEW